METQADPFASGAPDAPEDDPFADPAPDPAAEVAGEAPAPPEQPPVVNREGQPVEEETPPPPEQQQTAEPPAQAAQTAEEAPVQPGPDEQAAQQAEVAQEEQEAPAAEPEEEVAGEEQPEAPANGETGPRGGKVANRHYKLLYQTGEGQWTERELPEGNENVAVVDGERWLVCRNNDHALRLGFSLAGKPDAGITLFPIPKGAWKPKRIKPKAVPVRESLEISAG